MAEWNRRQFLLYGGLSLVTVGTAVLVSKGAFAFEESAETAKKLSPNPIPVNWDTLIWNGKIIDGTGAPLFLGALAIEGDKISALFREKEGARPGRLQGDNGQFSLAENEQVLQVENYDSAISDIREPLTFWADENTPFVLPEHCKIINAAGRCVTPGFIDVHSHNEAYLRTNPEAELRLTQGITTQIGGNCGNSVPSITAFRKELGPLGLNYSQLVGYRNLRNQVIGDSARKATTDEIDKMVALLEAELADGAPGFSVALEYHPQTAITTQELEVYARVVKDFDKILAVHLRSESDGLLEAFDEVLSVARQTGVAVQYGHVKALFQANWSKHSLLMERFNSAIAEGIDLWGDVYAYDFSSWDFGTNRVSISEANLIDTLQQDRIFVGSDSGLYEGGRVNHPRACGNFPRILARYVRDKEVLSLETAIAKMTSLPARRFRFHDRGTLAVGQKADVLVFDPEQIQDRATRQQPGLISTGIDYLFVNGIETISASLPTKALAGQWL
ncbi:amidohydrolase family protein [Heliorestis acidaminivorans]|uniref:Amidohydrolase family protein n=1 Tax=Heliorestis acidaminivorans TaxID=553427 RepID=A0A6I0F3I5_9FIRM|nr:amidohydrolase family protein [Heliorestis acidaminivorans]KAB2953287.1 amidohydrolase family protein [Heliorestis acidaminivorans]